eukprot:8284975-Pyramimonas_sp.AAC.1
MGIYKQALLLLANTWEYTSRRSSYWPTHGNILLAVRRDSDSTACSERCADRVHLARVHSECKEVDLVGVRRGSEGSPKGVHRDPERGTRGDSTVKCRRPIPRSKLRVQSLIFKSRARHRCTLWDCQRTVRVSLLGSDESQGPGFRWEHLMLACLPVHYVHPLYRCRSRVPGKLKAGSPVGSRELLSRHGSQSV